MGLSKKLGGATQRALPISNAVPYKWSHQTYTVEDILKKFKLPCVVQCATDTCTVLWSDFQFDLRQPLLFYNQRSSQKVHAVCLKQDKGVLEELGPPLAIPEDYEGWFGATPKGINKVKRHLRIEGVANSTARRFVVTTKCPAFTSCRGPDGELQYVPHDVMPGEVLKRVCVMDSEDDDSDSSSLVNEHGPCLECLDEKDDDVIIPLSHRAITYEIAEMYPDDEERAFQISSVIKAGNSKLPRVITLVHGEPPQLAYTFTKMIRCYTVFSEDTILAATLDDPTSRCLELATDSCARFRLSLNEALVKKTCEYNNAFQICESFGSKFVTGIKTSFSLKPEISELDDIDLSFYESAAGSELQEIEANSEFEIAWGSVKKARLLMESNSVGDDSDSSSVEDGSAVPKALAKEGSEIEDVSSQMKTLEKTVSNSSDNSLPKHRDFTEQELKDLMQRKGMLNKTESSENTSNDLESLKENRVTDNPLFYFFQRNPDQNPLKMADQDEEEKSSAGDSPTPEDNGEGNVKKENPLSYLFEQPTQASSKVKTENPLGHSVQQNSDPSQGEGIYYNEIPPSGHLFQQSSDSSQGKGVYYNEISQTNAGHTSEPRDELSVEKTTSTGTDLDLEMSHFDHATVTLANEYKADDDDGGGGDDDFDSEIDEDVIATVFGTENTDTKTLVQPESSGLNPHLESAQFDHAVCKPAKEYSSDDDDDDDDEEDDDDDDNGMEDNKANDSIPSEEEQIPEAMQKLAFSQDVDMPSEEKDLSPDDDILFPIPPPDLVPEDGMQNLALPRDVDMLSQEKDLSPDDDILFPNPPPDLVSEDAPASSACTFSSFLGGAAEDMDSASLKEHNDESEAVDDLLSLAEMESTKVSSTELSNKNEFEITSDVQSDNQATKSKADNPADRLDSLLAEVSSLVNNSRFLKARKTSRSQEDTSKPSSLVKPEDGEKENPTITSNGRDFLIKSDAISNVAEASSPQHGALGKDLSVSTKQSASSIKHSGLESGSPKTQNHETKSLPRGKKSKVNSAINFYSGLDSKKSKSEDLTGALRRSRGEVNLAHIGHSSDKKQTAKELFEPFRSESTISSIFRVEQDQQNRFHSSKVKHHPHEHPHRQRQSSDLEDTEHDFRQGRKISFDDAENDSSGRRSQKESSTSRGKVLASVQNFERLSSASSSFSSNHSSSIGGSFRQSGSGKLVLISDVGLNMSVHPESQQARPADHNNQPETSSVLQSRDQVGDAGDYDEEVFSVEEPFMISKSGKVKANRLKKSYRPTVVHRMEGYVEREDFV